MLIAGCQSTHSTPLAPERDLPANSTVVERSGQKLLIENGRLTPDSVTGKDSDGQRFAVPRDSVASVEVSSLSWPRTLGVVYAGLFAVGFLIGERF
jgi:hypothetical protein